MTLPVLNSSSIKSRIMVALWQEKSKSLQRWSPARNLYPLNWLERPWVEYLIVIYSCDHGFYMHINVFPLKTTHHSASTYYYYCVYFLSAAILWQKSWYVCYDKAAVFYLKLSYVQRSFIISWVYEITSTVPSMDILLVSYKHSCATTNQGSI